MSQPTRKIPESTDYPATAFFSVYKGHRIGVVATYIQLIRSIENYPYPVYEVFDNKAHAEKFAKTGVVPDGVTPIQPGAHSPLRRTTSLAGAGKLSAKNSRNGFGLPTSGAGVSRTGSTSTLAGTSAKLVSTSSAPAFRSPTRAGRPTTSLVSSQPSTSTIPEPSQTPKRGYSTSTTTSNATTNKSSVSRSTSTTSEELDAGLEKGIEVWTDGSCLGNGKPGSKAAYAVYFGPNDPRNEAGRVPGVQTNNRGELLGVIRALEIVDEKAPALTIYTDSKYTIQCPEWLPGWLRREGRNSSNKPAQNYQMIRYMVALMDRRGDRLRLLHVQAHGDNVGNNAVDELARDCAKQSPNVPPECDWDAKRLRLERQPPAPVTGSPVIASIPLAVANSPQRVIIPKGSIARTLQKVVTPPKEPDSDNEFDCYDDDIELADIDESQYEVEQPLAAPPLVIRTPEPSHGKRTRDHPAKHADEIEDSETERRARIKEGKRRRVQCPSCEHKFNI